MTASWSSAQHQRGHSADGRLPTSLRSHPVTQAVAINANSVANGATGVTDAALPTDLSYTRAGNLTTDAQGFLTTASGQYVVGYSTPQAAANAATPGSNAAQTAAGSTYLYIPPGSTNISIGQTASRHLHRQHDRHDQLRTDLHRRLPRAGVVPERGRSDA